MQQGAGKAGQLLSLLPVLVMYLTLAAPAMAAKIGNSADISDLSIEKAAVSTEIINSIIGVTETSESSASLSQEDELSTESIDFGLSHIYLDIEICVQRSPRRQSCLTHRPSLTWILRGSTPPSSQSSPAGGSGSHDPPYTIECSPAFSFTAASSSIPFASPVLGDTPMRRQTGMPSKQSIIGDR